MNLKQLHKTLIFLLCAAALVACNKTTPVQNGTDQSGKTPITLSIGGVDSQEQGTKVITDGDGKTLHALPHGSSIYMLMKADDLSDTPQTTLCTRTVGFAQDISTDPNTSNVSFTASNEGAKFTRYWDDVFARKSAISIAAVCTPGYGPIGGLPRDNKAWKIGGNAIFNVNTWTPISAMGSTAPNLVWPIGNSTVTGVTDQSSKNPDFITYHDLCFSNNIGDNTEQGKGDTRLKFKESNKQFTSGKLIFYHALSKLTFNIKMGEGFSDDEFKFKEGTNIKLSNFYNGGTFNISTGEFANDLVRTDINKIFQRDLTSTETTEGIKFGLDALVIPGTDLTTSTQAVTFILAGNEYQLSMAQLYAAFSSDQKSNYFNEGKLKAGVHYVFTFTVAKTKISGITAQVVDWEDVTANNINPTNARISLQLEDRGTALTKGVDFYRAKDTGNSEISDTYQGYNWSSGYEKGTGNFDGTTWKPTNWYWPDNTTFYHFRAVGEKKDASPSAPTVSNDAFALAAGQSYNDYIWGAPFKELDSPTPGANTTKIVYNFTNGFDGTFDGSNASTHQIYFGIGPTTDQIKLLMFHMMSDVTVNVQSVTGDGAVALTVGDDKTAIHFENIYTGGSVALGNGLVSTTGDATTEDLTMSSTDNQWLYGAIPQNLDGPTTATTDDVILVITTPDHNQYKVSMKGVKAETVTDNNLRNPYSKVGGSGDDKDMYIIDKWYPGFKYTYTFKLSKKKIEDIKATIVGWEEVTAGDEVQIQ